METSNLNNLQTTIELFNASGARVFNSELDQLSGKTVIPVANPGFYTLKVSNKNEVQTFKIIGN